MPFLLFILFPIAEFYMWYVFIDRYSFVDALLLMFFGGGIGLLIIRTQGQGAMLELQRSLAAGQMPNTRLLHRGIIILGGFLILLPGILTKLLGTIFILPGLRHFTIWFLKWYFIKKIAKGAFKFYSMGSFASGFSTRFDGVKVDPFQAERDVVEVQAKKIEHHDKNK